MKRGIQCNETIRYPKKNWNRISYEFACGIDGIPETYTLKLGERDPVTGEILDDPEFFAAYHRLRNNEVKQNQIEAGCTLKSKDRQERAEMRKRLEADFERKHGFPTEKEALEEMLDHAWPMPQIHHIEQTFNEEEQCWDTSIDCADPGAEAAFPGDEPDDVIAMREIYEGLSDRQKAVYRMMLEKTDAGAEQQEWMDLAKRWSVSHTQIRRDREKIIQIIIRKSETTFRFSYDRREKEN